MFELESEDKKARAGILKTRHGKVKTPFFMPVATRASGKCIAADDYKKIGADAIIANAFLLSLRPGTDIIKNAGGLHKFMNYNKTIFTDCGGFQVSRSMHMGNTKKGLWFKSPFDQTKQLVTPEKIMQVQQDIKCDVAMALDDMAAYGSTYERFTSAIANTHRWTEASLKAHTDKKQLVFGISQGGFFKDLRKKSAKFMSNLDVDGVSIGGVAIGEPKDEMLLAVKSAIPHITKNKPRYLMGVGNPIDMLECIELGVDCFDSVYPTKNARHGTIFTWKGRMDIRKTKNAQNLGPIDEACACYVCKTFSKSYIHHLIRLQEPVGKRYASIHNLHFMQDLMRKTRTAIIEGEFVKFKKEFIKSQAKTQRT